MSAQLIEQAAADGVQLFLADGRVGYRGKPEALRRWLPRIKAQRDGIAAALATPVLWWRFAVHCPARTVEVDFASGATEAEGLEIIRALYPDAATIFPLLAYPRKPEDVGEPRETEERVPSRASGTDAVRVRCCNCGRFMPHEAHTAVGRCGVGKLPPGAAGFWGTDHRMCEQFEQREQISDTRSINHPTTPQGGD
ncbi:hypothetical protein [Methylotetracoccus oryzae]|uniref:hypothetical protein n=1 Tax=Methylotetracoccus oryzae TaxID=1919059 RepID=UPI00111AEF5A|nr:hypothetical protein [Methylotetracoccus oryzae]